MPLCGLFAVFFGGKNNWCVASVEECVENKDRQLTSLLASLVQEIPAAIYRTRGQNGLLIDFISGEIENLTEYTLDEVRDSGNSWESIIHPEDLSHLVDRRLDALATLQTYEIRYRLITRSQRIVWVLDKGRAVLDPSKEEDEYYYVGFVTELSINNETGTQLQQAQGFANAILGNL
jgi:PAS domain-containing protein